MKALSGRGLCKEEPLKLSYISFLVNLSHLKKKKKHPPRMATIAYLYACSKNRYCYFIETLILTMGTTFP